MPFSIVRNNITEMHTDAIVNTANPRPVIGSGVDCAIHEKAGPKLLEARCQVGHINRGMSAITPAFDLPAKYVIHTVGPVWKDGKSGEAEILRGCYESALRLAADHGCESIAFPLISAGNYGFPKDLALQTAINAISSFLMNDEDMMIYLVVFDRTAYALSEKLFSDVKSYIDENLVETLREEEYRSNTGSRVRYEYEADMVREECIPDLDFLCEDFIIEDHSPAPSIPAAPSAPSASSVSAPAHRWKRTYAGQTKSERKLEDLLGQVGESFSQALVRMIDERGLKDSEVYKRANMDRKHFSKMINNIKYKPKPETAISLAIALKLNLDETRDFLARAGFALSRSSERDIIVEYFIVNGIYDIFELNQVLFQFTGQTLDG